MNLFLQDQVALFLGSGINRKKTLEVPSKAFVILCEVTRLLIDEAHGPLPPS